MISFVINGNEFKNLKSAEVSDSIDEFAGSFRFTTSSKIGINAGDLCVAIIDGIEVVTGYIDSSGISYNKSSNETTFSGRSLTQDIIDSSIGSDVEFNNNVSLVSVIESILKGINSEIKIINNAGNIMFSSDEKVSGEVGDNAFDLISSYCKRKKVMITSTGVGEILLFNGNGVESDFSIINKKPNGNVKSGTFARDLSGRYHKYIVSSQLGNGFTINLPDINANEISYQSGISFDDKIRESRILNIQADQSSNKTQCQDRADWFRNMRRALSIRYSAKVAGHSQNNKTWFKGALVNILDEKVFSEGVKMLAKKVTFSEDLLSGSETKIDFVAENVYSLAAEEEISIETDDGFSL